ncbi:hypothetical protein V8D89_015608 [Ganoderma adspersum]
MSQMVPDQYKKGYKPPFQTQQRAPGAQHKLQPPPLDDVTADGKPYKPAAKLEGRKVIITGADSGIGRSVALLFALEGADLTVTYHPEEERDFQEMFDTIVSKAEKSRKIVSLACDLRKEHVCQELVKRHLEHHGTLDAVVLNHGTQQANKYLPTLSTQQWHETFATNVHSFFHICKALIGNAAVPHLQPGSSITFNASINMATGHPELVDYSATKGAIIGFMRALSNQLVGEKGIRCNAVAPGPIWTPLIPATMTEESIEKFGISVPMGRAGQPVEVATAFVYLASADSSYISGQVLHVNGGVVIE